MAQTFDINNFVIDRVLRGLMTNKDGDVLWSINQITNPTLSCTTESTDAVDALGTKIMSFERAKTAEFSAENSLFDLGLAAAQFGSEKEVATSEKKIIVPTFETIDIGSGSSVTLKHSPVGQLKTLYVLKGDSTLGAKFTNGEAASATQFVHAEDTNTITIPTGLAAGTQLFVTYEYETSTAVSVNNSGATFPKTGKFIMEVLGCDICDQNKLVHAYIVFGNAKLLGNVDMTFTTEGTHPFTIQAQQVYCDKEKRLFSIIVPEEE